MTKHVQLYGDSIEVLRLYVGPTRELVVDETNFDLLLQDGVTLGGHRFASVTNLATLFQAKSPELNGFSFTASAFGIMVRKTPGSYALRTLAVDTANLALADGSGVVGDPTFSLAATITSEHTFSTVLTGAAGFVGDLTGDTAGSHVGPSIGQHTGNVIGDVTGDVLGNSFGVHTGDVDVRGAELQLDDGQITWDMLSAETQAEFVKRGIPLGGVILWSGVIGAIPAGWFLCDGTNGTPNLVDRFIVGSTGTYAHLATGGAVSHTHAVTNDAVADHTHTLTIANHILTGGEMPPHKHYNGVCGSSANVFNHSTLPAAPNSGKSIDENGAAGTTEGFTSETGSGAGHGHVGSLADAGGAHTHTNTVNTVSHLPPYFALAYIMKGV